MAALLLLVGQYNTNWWYLAALPLVATISAGIPGDPWLRLNEAADRLKVHSATLRRAIRRGDLRAARVSGRKAIRIRASWADAYLEDTAPVEVKR